VFARVAVPSVRRSSLLEYIALPHQNLYTACTCLLRSRLEYPIKALEIGRTQLLTKTTKTESRKYERAEGATTLDYWDTSAANHVDAVQQAAIERAKHRCQLAAGECDPASDLRNFCRRWPSWSQSDDNTFIAITSCSCQSFWLACLGLRRLTGKLPPKDPARKGSPILTILR